MVKAIKRTQGIEGASLKKKTKSTKLMVTIVLLLLVLGFTIAGYFGMSQNSGQQTPGEEQNSTILYGIGTRAGSEKSKVSNITKYNAVFGQLATPLDTERRLNGDLYLLDQGYSQLILTNASADKIDQWTTGEFVIYRISTCSDFDCLIDNETAANLTNETLSFDIYTLNTTSRFLKTRTVGLPSAKVAITL